MKNKIVIVYLIKGKAEKYQQKLVKKVGPMFGETYMIEHPLPAHITLKSPFETDKLKKIESFLKEFVKKYKSDKIQIRGFGNFNKFVAFLNLKLGKSSKKVQKNLVAELKKQGIKPHKFDIKWKPHMTISYGNTKKSFNKIWNHLQTLEKPKFDLRFDNVSILKKIRGHWRIYKQFKIE